MEVIDLDALARLQRPALLLPRVIATLGAVLVQITFFFLPLVALALIHALGAGEAKDLELFLVLAGLLAAVLLPAFFGLALHGAFLAVSERRLWLTLGLLWAAVGLWLLVLRPGAGWGAGVVLGAGGLSLMIRAGFGGMRARLAADPAGRALLTGLALSRTVAARRLRMRGWRFALQSLGLALRLALIALLFTLAAVVHLAVSITLPQSGLVSSFIALIVVRPLVSTLAVGAVRRFRARTARTAAQLYDVDRRPPLLLLRSFRDDSLTVPFAAPPWFRAWGVRRRRIALEEAIAETAFRFGPVGAVQDPASRLRPLGAARELLADGNWQDHVAAEARRAACVILVQNTTPGLRWEQAHLREAGHAGKTITVFPDRGGPPETWADPSAGMGAAGLDLGRQRPLCHLVPEPGRPVLIVARAADAGTWSRALLVALALVLRPGAAPVAESRA